ncbi:hypothetical protein EIP91_002230 [Steccherinum ochraceum]|uniref:Glucose-methanol-choline oxidoreductase N-terminal domain-containing protein n=1 Tax=Steccherinum ochraceum TaxID=92696 RepID=A0A4R0REY9_9APHY|nr:hypothetical protein EIP91_002230 [Steccherinum ochraceum]
MTARIQEVVDRAFDYVIVGGGTAGLTLAARITEDPSKSVLVLEAGKANIDDPLILRPFSYGAHFANLDHAWGFKTIKQQYAENKESQWQRGKGLGGSSAINFMCYVKPPAEDINDVERLGNPGFNFEHYNRLLKRTEGFVAPTDEALAQAQLKSGLWQLGTNANPFGGDTKGYYVLPNTYDPISHTRSYATTAFYLPNKDRPNLVVLVEAPVGRVITDTASSGKIVARGVEFTHDGRQYTAKANKEVILSAGSPRSPQLLELSGIGNEDILNKIGVPVKINLPAVGENVQEHVFMGMSFELKDDVVFDTTDILRDPEVAAKHVNLHKSGSGAFTQGIVGFAFTSLDMITPRANEIITAAKAQYTQKMETSPAWLKDQYATHLARLDRAAPGYELILFPGFLSFPNPPAAGKRYITLCIAMNHMFSRGTIHSSSDDPAQDAEFNPHDFEEDIDVEVAVEMLRFIRKLSKTAPLQDILLEEVNPGKDTTSDADLASWVKKSYSTTYHTAGPCSMLPKERGGVVDTDMKVYGTENLRVVDLSVLPILPAAHTLATVYAIAEHAAEAINGRST